MGSGFTSAGRSTRGSWHGCSFLMSDSRLATEPPHAPVQSRLVSDQKEGKEKKKKKKKGTGASNKTK